MTTPASLDRFTPAFHQLVQEVAPSELQTIFRTTERHRIVGGKSVRLLCSGDRVAIGDLYPHSMDSRSASGVGVVTDADVVRGDDVRVVTAGHGTYLVAGSRLVLIHRKAGDTHEQD